MTERTALACVFSDDAELGKCHLVLDAVPDAKMANRIASTVGPLAAKALAVVVPFEDLLDKADLTEANWWSGSTRQCMEAPLGPRGRYIQNLRLGEGTSHHVLVAGKTGSGKSTLLHTMIMGLALRYSPDELKLYLIDFKEGVEFKVYAEHKLPHAEVVAIETEQEFGLSVLRGLDEELTRRGVLFRERGAKHIAEYRDLTGETIPRIFLIADEFQGLFTPNDAMASEARQLLDRVIMQGRSFGAHVLLATQTLAQARLPTGMMGQFHVRIALMCSSDDSRIILSDGNDAARLLSRQGEAYYNAEGGAKEGNLRFQVAKAPEDTDGYLSRVRGRISSDPGRYVPVVFEGDKAADIEECTALSSAMVTEPVAPLSSRSVFWLGQPISLSPPLQVTLGRRPESNLLVVARDESDALGVLASAFLGLIAQHCAQEVEFYVLDFAGEDTTWPADLRFLADSLPHQIHLVQKREITNVAARLADELRLRAEGKTIGSNIFVLVQGLRRATDLQRDEDRFDEAETPHDQFMKLLRDGPDYGMHSLVWADSYASIVRILGVKGIRGFGFRVAGIMTKEDSQLVIDDAAAGKIDKRHRMVFYDLERPGALGGFRPYKLPDREWLTRFTEHILGRENARLEN